MPPSAAPSPASDRMPAITRLRNLSHRPERGATHDSHRRTGLAMANDGRIGPTGGAQDALLASAVNRCLRRPRFSPMLRTR